MVLKSGVCLPSQPDHFHVAVTFGFQHPGRAHAMQITVEIKLEQHRRVIRWPARVGAPGLGKTQRVQIQLGDEGIEEAHGVFGGNVILQAFGKEQRLRTIQTKTMVHTCHRPGSRVIVQIMFEFSHSLSPEPPPIIVSVPHSRLTDMAARLSFCR